MRDRLSVQNQKTASVLRMCIELYIRIILRTYGYVDMYVQHPTPTAYVCMYIHTPYLSDPPSYQLQNE